MPIPKFLRFDKVWKFFAPIFVLLLFADQITKWLAVTNLRPNEIKDFGFALSYNEGIVFGLDLPIWGVYLLTVLVFALGIYLVVEYKLWRDHFHIAALSLLTAGAIGNVIDRVRFGYVIDFLKVYWWPTFNLADVFIVVAVVLFAWEFLVREDAISEI